MNDALTHLGRTGLLDKWQLACAYAYDVWRDTGELPPAKSIPAAVSKQYGVKRMSESTAFRALDMLRQTLPKKK